MDTRILMGQDSFKIVCILLHAVKTRPSRRCRDPQGSVTLPMLPDLPCLTRELGNRDSSVGSSLLWQPEPTSTSVLNSNLDYFSSMKEVMLSSWGLPGLIRGELMVSHVLEQRAPRVPCPHVTLVAHLAQSLIHEPLILIIRP